jgi:hypothetical protein
MMDGFIWWFGAISLALYGSGAALFLAAVLMERAVRRAAWWPRLWRFMVAEVKEKAEARRRARVIG